jgi:hypothetical protein
MNNQGKLLLNFLVPAACLSFIFMFYSVNPTSVSAEPLPVYKISPSPRVDGAPDDPAWQNMPEERVFKMVTAEEEPGVPGQDTSVMFGYDRRNLYILVVCEETNISGLKAPEREPRQTASLPARK